MKENESEWLVRAIEGDDQAFTRLVELYQNPVYNLCYRMLGTPGDAEDAAQEAFLRAYKNLQRYDRKRSFATWLLSIASHYCIDQLRRKKGRKTQLWSELREHDQERLLADLSQDSNYESGVAEGTADYVKVAQALLEGLNPKTQAARIGGSVGTRKRMDIEKKAEELNIRLLNL